MTPNKEMVEKLAEALKLAHDVYTLEDIIELIEKGTLQGHVEGDTWVVTQVHTFPRKRIVEILYVVGDLNDSIRMEKKIEQWARELNADLIIATGREGWWDFRTPGWKKTGVTYAKDLKNG